MEPALITKKETALYFMEWVLPAHTVISAAEDMASTAVKAVTKFSPDTKRQIEYVLGDFGFLVEADVEAIVESTLTNWINTPH